jgi:hypothetical protein
MAEKISLPRSLRQLAITKNWISSGWSSRSSADLDILGRREIAPAAIELSPGARCSAKDGPDDDDRARLPGGGSERTCRRR